jgi:hypothetical protein
MEQDDFVVTFKGDVIELRIGSGPLVGAVTNSHELGFILCNECSWEFPEEYKQSCECSNLLLH